MKSISIPDTVIIDKVKKQDGTEEDIKLSFIDFARQGLDQYPEFGKGLANIKKGLKLHKALDALNGGKILMLEDDDYNSFKAAIDAAAWHPKYARFFVPFFDAINDAKQEILTNGRPAETPTESEKK